MYATSVLFTLLFGGSVFVWCQLAGRWRRREPFLDLNQEPRADWRSAGEFAGVYVVLFWTVNLLLPYFISRPIDPHQVIGLKSVVVSAAVNFGLALVLPLMLVSSGRPCFDFGITTLNCRDQIATGFRGFFAAVLPMAISMAAMTPFRGPENQHSFLKLLSESPGSTTVALVAVTAVLSAPLQEEMTFRVILQGWLATLFPPSVAIGVVATVFAFVHGWRDGLALLPLAIILGYVFHRRHSYLAVVVIHALFNATMLALQLLMPEK